jgi:hypothetical protein
MHYGMKKKSNRLMYRGQKIKELNAIRRQDRHGLQVEGFKVRVRPLHARHPATQNKGTPKKSFNDGPPKCFYKSFIETHFWESP